jgi:hypothetical protein
LRCVMGWGAAKLARLEALRGEGDDLAGAAGLHTVVTWRVLMPVVGQVTGLARRDGGITAMVAVAFAAFVT